MAVDVKQVFETIGVAATGASVLISGMMLRLQMAMLRKVDADMITKRLESLEQQTAQMPKHSDLTSIAVRINVVEVTVATTVAQNNAIIRSVEGVGNQVALIMEHLLDRDHK
jgi:hypothetical protein